MTQGQEFEYTITISADGKTVDGTVHGIKGKACSKVAKILDGVGTELEDKHTDEWDQDAPTSYQIGTSSTDTITVGGY